MSSGAGDSWEGRILASQFQIQEPLGKGGMGVVYRATQLGMDRTVVIKVMHAALSANRTAVERFRREAQSVGKLNHPNIVQVHMFGEAQDGDLYIAMEFVDGRSLSAESRTSGAMHEARALRIIDQVLSALVEAHGVGIIHRDLKPDNIMLTNRQGNADYAKVLDFGLAKVFGDVQGDDTITQAGMVTGTPRYMSPEQARGLKLDARTDIYSLGVVLYEMLTGKHPFDAESALDYMHKHTSAPVPGPRERVDGLQLMPRTEQVLMKALAKKPEDRFQSAREMQREVRTILRDFPDAARSAATPLEGQGPVNQGAPGATTTVRRSERRRLVTAVAILAAATLVLLLAMLLMFSQASRQADKKQTAASGSVASPVEPPAPSAMAPAKVEGNGPVAVSETLLPAKAVERPATATTWREATGLPSEFDDEVDEARLRAEIEAAVAAALAAHGGPEADGQDDLVPPTIDYVAPKAAAATDEPAEVQGKVAPVDRTRMRQLAFAGAMAPGDAELVARTGQVCNFATASPPEQVLTTYRDWARDRKYPFQEHGDSLHIRSEASPIQTVTLSRDGSVTTRNPHLVTVLFREGRAPVMAVGEVGPLGEPLPAGVVLTTLTPHAVVYETEQPVKEVAPFYLSRYDGQEGIMVTRNRVMGGDQLVIFSQRASDPFLSITVMKNFTKRDSTQITVSSRDMMTVYGDDDGI